MNREKFSEDTLVLDVPVSVKRVLDERAIRIGDVKSIIVHAENTGEKILNEANGRFIAHLVIGNITCWAEYAAQGGEYVLYNAYFHRISVRE